MRKKSLKDYASSWDWSNYLSISEILLLCQSTVRKLSPPWSITSALEGLSHLPLREYTLLELCWTSVTGVLSMAPRPRTEQHEYHLETCYKCKFSYSSQIVWGRHSGGGIQQSVNKSSRCFQSPLKLENYGFRNSTIFHFCFIVACNDFSTGSPRLQVCLFSHFLFVFIFKSSYC